MTQRDAAPSVIIMNQALALVCQLLLLIDRSIDAIGSLDYRCNMLHFLISQVTKTFTFSDVGMYNNRFPNVSVGF